MGKSESHRVWQIRVDLNGIRPPVWRRILVSDRITLRDLHGAIQAAFGWQDSHLHEFTIHDLRYGDPAIDELGDFNLKDEAKTRLSTLILGEGDRFAYTYDFGDGWEHTLRVEKILPVEKGMEPPRCIGGKRACPPEDVGGVWGYAEFLEALDDPRHPEHETYTEWIGGAFDHEAFDLQAANERLARRAGGRPPAEDRGAAAWPRFDLSRLEPLAAGHEATARDLPLRRDAETFLVYIRDHQVTGTSATGNLPLRSVAEIASRFVHPPRLETEIGDKAYRIRREDEVWPVFFVHVLAQAAGLVSGGPARRWRLEPAGGEFLASTAVAQVFVLLATWWYRVNWLVAVPFGISGVFGEQLPPDVPPIVRSLLRESAAGQPLEFDPFVDRLIEQAGWTWPRREPDFTRSSISAAVDRMVVRPMSDFGALSAERVPDPDSSFGLSKLASFSLTGFGRALLDALP